LRIQQGTVDINGNKADGWSHWGNCKSVGSETAQARAWTGTPIQVSNDN